MIHAMNAEHEVMLSTRALTDGATATANLDKKGADFVTINLNFKAEEGTDSGATTISLLESDDTVVTNFVTVVANRSEDLASAHQVVYHVDTRARKRYLRLSVTAATVTGSDITFGAVAILSRLSESPQSTTEMVASTNDGVTIV